MKIAALKTTFPGQFCAKWKHAAPLKISSNHKVIQKGVGNRWYLEGK